MVDADGRGRGRSAAADADTKADRRTSPRRWLEALVEAAKPRRDRDARAEGRRGRLARATIDGGSGTVSSARNLPDWEGTFTLGRERSQALGARVVVGNDVEVATEAEYLLGAGAKGTREPDRSLLGNRGRRGPDPRTASAGSAAARPEKSGTW